MAEAKKEVKAEVKTEAPKKEAPPAPKAESKSSSVDWKALGYVSEKSYRKFNH